MRNLVRKLRESFSNNSSQTAVTFLVSGFLSGAIFTALTHSSALENFFFEPRIKFPEPRFSWWAALSLFSILGIIVGFLISRRRADFVRAFRLTVSRQVVTSALLLSALPVSMYFLKAAALLKDNLALLLLVPLVFLTVVGLAQCFATRSLKRFPAALILNLTVSGIGIAAHVLLVRYLSGQNSFVYEFGQWTFLFASVSFGFGVWMLISFARIEQKDV